MYNIIWMRSCATVIAVEKQSVLHTLSLCLQPMLSGMQSACAVLYRHMWPVRLYRIVPYYLISDTKSVKIIESKYKYMNINI